VQKPHCEPCARARRSCTGCSPSRVLPMPARAGPRKERVRIRAQAWPGALAPSAARRAYCRCLRTQEQKGLGAGLGPRLRGLALSPMPAPRRSPLRGRTPRPHGLCALRRPPPGALCVMRCSTPRRPSGASDQQAPVRYALLCSAPASTREWPAGNGRAAAAHALATTFSESRSPPPPAPCTVTRAPNPPRRTAPQGTQQPTPPALQATSPGSRAPSTVTTCMPSTLYSGARHAFTERCHSSPSASLDTMTVHAPQPPSPQPSLVPVRPCSARQASASRAGSEAPRRTLRHTVRAPQPRSPQTSLASGVALRGRRRLLLLDARRTQGVMQLVI